MKNGHFDHCIFDLTQTIFNLCKSAYKHEQHVWRNPCKLIYRCKSNLILMCYCIFLRCWINHFCSLHLRLIHWRQLTESWNTWTAPRPNQRPSDPPTWSFCFYFHDKLFQSHLREKAAEGWLHQISFCQHDFWRKCNVNNGIDALVFVQEFCLCLGCFTGQGTVRHTASISQVNYGTWKKEVKKRSIYLEQLTICPIFIKYLSGHLWKVVSQPNRGKTR